jgi:transposase InsO family protein
MPSHRIASQCPILPERDASVHRASRPDKGLGESAAAMGIPTIALPRPAIWKPGGADVISADIPRGKPANKEEEETTNGLDAACLLCRPPLAPSQRRSMDFVSDSSGHNRSLRVLTVIDDFTREGLALEKDTSLPGERMARMLDRIALKRGYPKAISVEDGPEFAGKFLDEWAYNHAVAL